VKDAKVKAAPSEGEHWGSWLVDVGGRLAIPLEAPFRDLVLRVGAIVPAAQGLEHFLNQLEPAARDLALKTPGVAIMTMGRSKGLTFRATFVMGVEEGVVPFAKAKDPDEERRLLYVAMTRPREFLFLTMASRRTDRTGWTGEALQRDRSRCPFFSVLGVGLKDGDPFLGMPSCC
jgi:DNA helicase-2/ATP-dependent DNA helicase PcrA